jgi:hypothetical protein
MLNQIKEYCKNDVRMTALLFMYLLYFGKVYMDGEEYNYDVAKFLQYAQIRKKKADLDKARTQSLL